MCRNYSRDNWQHLKKNTQSAARVSKCDYKKYEMYKKLGDFCLEKKKGNSEKKLIRRQRCIKAMRKKISCPSEIYELQPLPVCVLCCLMAAVVSDWQCANATHSVQTCQSREEGRKKYKKKKKKYKIRNENARSALQRRGLYSCHFSPEHRKTKC